jgi:hypothetical protein
VQASLSYLYGDLDEEPPFPRQVAKALYSIVLGKNYFEFNGKVYRQRQGTAMGTRVAPTYANLFMAQFEKSH